VQSPSPAAGAVRVFIGSGETSVLERKVLIRSLKAHTKRQLHICVFNGTHNALEWNAEPPTPAPMSLEIKYRNYTEFSLYRFLIPEICGFRGNAIYMDSDMLCFADIGELFDLEMDGLDLRCVPSLYGDGTWATSIMLINCESARFDLPGIMQDLDAWRFSYDEFMRLAPRFRQHHHLAMGELDPSWNVFDAFPPRCKVLHFTNLFTQPWRDPRHPLAALWRRQFDEAIRSGALGEDDVRRAVALGHAHRSLLDPDPGTVAPSGGFSGLARILKRRVSMIRLRRSSS
jgi:hypothetical protein